MVWGSAYPLFGVDNRTSVLVTKDVPILAKLVAERLTVTSFDLWLHLLCLISKPTSP